MEKKTATTIAEDMESTTVHLESAAGIDSAIDRLLGVL